jgi:hypothetical protein
MTVPMNSGAPLRAFRPSTALVWFPNTCGWHVFLQSTSGSAQSALRPRVLAKMCFPYTRVPQYSTPAEILSVAASYLVEEIKEGSLWPHGA